MSAPTTASEIRRIRDESIAKEKKAAFDAQAEIRYKRNEAINKTKENAQFEIKKLRDEKKINKSKENIQPKINSIRKQKKIQLIK